MPPRVLLALLLFAAPAFAQDGPSSGGGGGFNTDSQVKLDEIEKVFRETIMKSAVDNGLDLKIAAGIAQQYVDDINSDPKLQANQGVDPEQLKAAQQSLDYAAKLFKLGNAAARATDPAQREQLEQEVHGIDAEMKSSIGQSGDLKPILESIRTRAEAAGQIHGTPGQGGAGPVNGSLYGPVQGGLLQGGLDAQAGHPDDALADYQKVASIDPKNSDAVSGESSALLDLGRYGEAYNTAQKALQMNPNDRNAVTVMNFAADRVDGTFVSGPPGKAGSGSGDISGAAGGAGGAGAGSTSSSVGARFASALSRLAGGGSAGGRAAGAAAASFRLARSAPSAAALAGMSGGQAQTAAQTALTLKDYASARAYVRRALAQDPNNPALLNMSSEIDAHGRDYAGAEADARAGLAVSPRSSELLRSLGFAQLRDKDFKGALATANEMLELNPNDAYAYALRGHAYGSMGDRDAMMADLNRAAELDPSFRDALAQMSGRLQLPSDKDILFLFPGEEDEAAAPAAAPDGRNRNFGLLVGASALGGLLIALALLNTLLAPLKEQVASVFTRITRTGPTVSPDFEAETPQPASINGVMPGLIRGQYEILRQIGAGGMGQVFEGLDRSLGRRVAIKKMREELRSDPREKARFVAEAKTVAGLHHPNIVDIYAIAESGDDVFLVFEHVDGKTVHELVQSRGRLDPAGAAGVVRASAEALEYAHARGVIHRDMKPSNVMVDAQGRVKVMDFGIARTAKDAMTRYSMTNTVVGTPPYMAPEQEQGQVRRESDVYALAVCAYEMLTGNLPFAGTGGGIMLNKINMSFTPPSRATAGLSPALDPVFDRAFQADPDRRYRTPKEFAGALESALGAGVRVA